MWEPRAVPILCRPHGSKLDSPKHVNSDTSPINLCQLLPPPPLTTLNNKDFSNVPPPLARIYWIQAVGVKCIVFIPRPLHIKPTPSLPAKKVRIFQQNKFCFHSSVCVKQQKRGVEKSIAGLKFCFHFVWGGDTREESPEAFSTKVCSVGEWI